MPPAITSHVPNREIVAMFIQRFLVSGLLGFPDAIVSDRRKCR